MLKDVEEVVKEILVEHTAYITEENFKKIKNQLGKKDDYFSIEELHIIYKTIYTK